MKYWEQAVYDFMCMRRGHEMHWEVGPDKIRLFIDDEEIDLEDGD